MPDNRAQHESSIFLRKSSGLVKLAGFWDVFIYNLGLISSGIGLAYVERYGPAYYPGANTAIASFYALFLMLFIGGAFWAWTTAIPRSG